ncbi:MAG: phosphopantetheine-binding protein [Desulfobacteraceae bacterium]|jgi:acyl carrier protein
MNLSSHGRPLTAQEPLQPWTEEAILGALKEMLPRVAPLKVTEPLFPGTSLAADLDFDSLDTVEMILAVNERFSCSLDFETWLNRESQRKDKPFTMGSLCRFILKTLEEA